MNKSDITELEEIMRQAPADKEMTKQDKANILRSYEDNDLQNKEKEEFYNKYAGQYYGRMDFDVEFYKDKREDLFKGNFYNRLYVGKQSVQDENNKYVIIDWREPLGEFFYEDRKRHLKQNKRGDNNPYCYDYELMMKRRFFDNPFRFKNLYIQGMSLYNKGDFDPYLLETLSELRKRRNEDALDIIETIQDEQNNIVRADIFKNFYVQGCAGSGKTMVLLHRLSWALYNHKFIDVSKVKIITSNDNLIEQLKKLSLQLEVSKIEQTTIEKYYLYLIEKYSKKLYRKYSNEYKNIYNENTLSSKLLDFIYSDEFLKIIDSNYRKYFKELFSPFSNLNFNKYDFSEIKNAYNMIIKNNQNDIKKIFYSADKKENNIYKLFFKHIKIKEDDLEFNLCEDEIVEEILKNSINTYYKEHKIDTKNKLFKHSLFICLYLLEKIYGEKSVDFLLNIDEAQDLSLNEYKVLSFANKNTIFNLYGDTNQLLYKNRGIDNWNKLAFLELQKYELNVNYRNNRYISRLCNIEFPSIKMISINIDEEGGYDYIDEDDLYEIEDEVIIVKDKSIVEKYYGENEVCNIIENKNDLINKKKVNIFTIDMVKGMEFKNVIVINDKMTKNEKYIAYTRALNYLKIYNER